MKQAILAAEDDRFLPAWRHRLRRYHPRRGDQSGSAAASAKGRRPSHNRSPRNFFLTGEKTYTRKLYEVLLSFKIESNLSKGPDFRALY
jgi:penicillin-binding protein 1A